MSPRPTQHVLDSAGSLQLPARFQFTMLDAEDGSPVEGIAATLTLFARMKNNYHLGLPLSDNRGYVVVTSKWVRAGIAFARNLLIMDYAGGLDECQPVAVVEIMSTEEINRAVSAMRLYGLEQGAPGIAPTVEELLHASNKEYEPQKVSVLLNVPDVNLRCIELRLERAQG